MASLVFTGRHRAILNYWLPALIAGALAWIAFTTLGHTPFIRASGMALVIVGITLTVRRLGAILAITGGMALAFTPAFWSQTGGADRLNLSITIITLVIAGGIGLLTVRFGQRLFWGFAAGLVIFSVLFWSQLATLGSLRLTTLMTAWLLFLVIDALLITNPRPDGPSPGKLGIRHKMGFLLLLAIGVINDPLFTLLAPAVILCLVLSQTPLPGWYCALLAVVIAVGVRGIAVDYLDSGWWLYPAAQAEALGIRVPYVMADGWREASRWLYLFDLVINQFTIVGVALGIVGLARMARWYPPIGAVTMIAYASYVLFGLVYFGKDSAILLLPLLMIQVLWMTYAVYTIGQWLQQSLKPTHQVVRWLAPAVFTLLPLLLLFRITGLL